MKLGTLHYDKDKGVGEVRIDWAAMPPDVMGLDALSDWLAHIGEIYEQEVEKVFSKGEST